MAESASIAHATDAPGPAVSVVVPVKDEAGNVRPLVEEVRAVLDPICAYEIVYVDDGSSDGTTRELEQLLRDVPELRAMRHARSCGQSAAIATGVEAARGAIVATLDGDGQNDPADLPSLLATFRAAGEPELTLIVGHRLERRESWLRRFSSRTANGVRASLLGDDTPDAGCGLKVFSRSAFLDMPRFDHMHRFLPALMIRRGGRVRSVRVSHRPRRAGRSKYGVWNRLWVGVVDLAGVIWLSRRGSRPEVTPLGGSGAAPPEGR